MKKVLLLVCLLGLAAPAHAMNMEASLNGGYGFSFSVETGDVPGYSYSKSGLAFGGDFLVDPGWVKDLMVGVEADYYVYSRYNRDETTLLTAKSGTFAAIPVLATAKWTFMENVYGLAGVGLASARSSLTDATTTTTTSDTHAGLMIGGGYTFPVTKELSIDPRAKLHLIMLDGGSAKTFIPSVNLTYHF